MNASARPDRRQPLRDQVAIVTGAGSGLGARFALKLASAGAAVALAGRRADKLEAVQEQIVAGGGQAIVVPTDMSDAAAIGHLVKRAEAELGIVRILINNAGVPDAQYATRMPLELIDQVLDTNLRGPFLLSTAVARRLMDAKLGGRIINISSMAAYHYDGGAASLYSVTKAGLSRMTEVLAVEWARQGINVNAIAPGFFDSEMTAGLQARVGNLAEKLPRGRIGQAEQLDSTLLYLCDPASEAVTGTIIRVDDGQMPR